MLIYYIESACCVCLIIPSRFLCYEITTQWALILKTGLSIELCLFHVNPFSWEQTFKVIMSYMERACGKGRRF